MVERHASAASAGDRLDRLFAALADPTRRAILARLRRGPATLSELAAPFELSFAAVSKHVAVLERAGLLRRRVVGREHRCALDARALRPAAEWTQAYRECWEGRLDALDAFLRGGPREARKAPSRPRRRKAPR